MLLFFRKWLTSWPVLALLSLVLLAFIVTGVNDPFGGGSSAPGVLAKVGKRPITEGQLLKQVDQILKRARETNPTLTAQTLAKEGGTVQVLDQMIGQISLEEFATKAGISVSDRAVDGEIASIAAFQSGGKFDQATYKRILAEQRISERELRDGIRGDLIRKQLLTPVMGAVQVPVSLAKPYAAMMLDLYKGEIALLPASALPAPAAPTEAQLTAFYTANKARYTLPERRAFRYALLDREGVAARVAVSDAEVQTYYDAHREQFGGIETRALAQVVVPDEARAKALVAAIRAGKGFAAAASEVGFSAADTDLGVQSQSKFASATNAAVAAAAFGLKAAGVTDPVKSDFGWHVVAVQRIIAAKSSGLAGARDTITASLRRDKTEAALSDAIAQIEDGFSGGASFADMVAKFKLAVVSVPAVTRDGRTSNAGDFTLAPAATPLLAKAFDADPADGPSVQELGKGQYAVLEVGNITPPTPAAAATIKPALVAAWTLDARMAKLKALADAVVADTAKGVPLARALASRQLPPAQPIAGRRLDAAQQGAQLPPAIRTFMSLAPGTTQAMVAPTGNGWFIIHLDSITPGDVAAVPQLLDSARQQIAQGAPDEIGAAFATAAGRVVGVSRNPAALTAATARIIGEGETAK